MPDAGGAALVLVGHGSRENVDAGAPVLAHVARLRGRGGFAEVRAAFWKQEPRLPDIIEATRCDDVVVVPLFMSGGWFTRQAIPRELGLAGPLTLRGRRRIRYAPPVGEHPRMAALVARTAAAAAEAAGIDPGAAAVLVVGHGTERSATSGGTTHAVTAALARDGGFGDVACAFLDQAPRIPEAVQRLVCDTVIVAPFFASAGMHTSQTIPAELARAGTRPGTRRLITPPVGTLEDVAELVLELAGAAVRGSGGLGGGGGCGGGKQPDSDSGSDSVAERAG